MSQTQQAGVGHNSGQTSNTPKPGNNLKDGPGTVTWQKAVDRLRNLVDRIERLEEEDKALRNDIRDIYAEGKSAGFDPKVLRELIKIRRKPAAEVEEAETMLDIYRRSLGM